MNTTVAASRALRLRSRVWQPGDCGVLAILNRTPDSFFDQGAYVDDATALEAVDALVASGADGVDLGGVRAGPGAEVDAAAEHDRVVPFVAMVRDRHPDLVISIDTWRAEVAEAALGAGADLVNDAWGGVDAEIMAVAAAHGAGYVCAHTGGHRPRQDPHRVRYRDLPGSLVADLTALAGRAAAAGVREDAILIDAAPDFGKNTYHSLAATAATADLVATGWPVLVAVSNKKFLAEALGLDGAKSQRLVPTLAATAVTVWEGARLVRAHDVAATRQVVDTVLALRSGRPAQARRALA